MKTKSLAVLLAATTLSGSALAQAYLGAGIGRVRVNLDCAGATTCDRSDSTYKLYGGYRFGPNFGVEAAFYDNGKLHQAGTDPELGRVSATWKGDGFGLFAVGTLPVDRFSVFAKLGVTSVRVKLDATSSLDPDTAVPSALPASSGTTVRVSDSERHAAVAFGVGAGYAFTPRLGARLEYERLRLQFMDDKRNANLVTLGMHFNF